MPARGEDSGAGGDDLIVVQPLVGNAAVAYINDVSQNDRSTQATGI